METAAGKTVSSQNSLVAGLKLLTEPSDDPEDIYNAVTAGKKFNFLGKIP